jgi:hypothetical protein
MEVDYSTVRWLLRTPDEIHSAQLKVSHGHKLHSQHEIGREPHISPMTVAKIIKAEDFQNFLKEQQERVFAMAAIGILFPFPGEG